MPNFSSHPHRKRRRPETYITEAFQEIVREREQQFNPLTFILEHFGNRDSQEEPCIPTFTKKQIEEAIASAAFVEGGMTFDDYEQDWLSQCEEYEKTGMIHYP